MLKKTRDHLTTASRNRTVAERLVGRDDTETISAEWAIIAAFYAAVHIVNAFVWERQSLEPINHEERAQFVSLSSVLRPHAQTYARLSINAYHARYTPEYRLEPNRARLVVVRDLGSIEVAIVSDLNRS
jgi:hypothetical protein